MMNGNLVVSLFWPIFTKFPISTIASLAVAQEMNHKKRSSEVKESTPKIQKLEHEVQLASVPFFRVQKLSDKAIFPSRGSPHSTGNNLSSAVDTKVQAREKVLVPTDLDIAVLVRTYALLMPRSGLTWKNSIDVGAGAIDADYRGPIGVVLFNHSDVDLEVKASDRIAQLIIQKIVTPELDEVDDLDVTVRGPVGFGSMGV